VTLGGLAIYEHNLFGIWGLKLLQIRKYILFSHTNIAYNALTKTLKNGFKRRLLGLFCVRVMQYFGEICEFTIFGLIVKLCGSAICELA